MSDNDNDSKEDEKEDLNPFFSEPLYIGNLSLPSSTDKYYRWIIFVTTSSSEIIKPKSISSVTYILHPTHPNPKQIKTKSPFFLDISGWGIFQIDIIITFKNNFIRGIIETSHMLSVDSPTSITCVENNARTYHKTLWKYKQFKQFANEINIGNVSFVKKVKHRLRKNLLRTPSPVYFEGFKLRLNEFKYILKKCVDLPEIIYDIIGYFSVFYLELSDIMPNQEMYIEYCNNCDIIISANKFNHLRLRRCDNINITFPYIMSKCELIDCNNVNIICNKRCYTYRFDECNNINVQFIDPGTRVTFLCFNTPNVILNVSNIKWKEEPINRLDIYGDEIEAIKYNKYDENMDLIKYNNENKYPKTMMYCVPFEKGEKERISVRWRSDKNIEFSWKVFQSKYTLGQFTLARRT
eukprot:319363_1